jgi:asparagine synthase (glutamine-hydrolysing)
MCRIAGRVSKENSNLFCDSLKVMLGVMAHGGPDDEGTYFHEGIALGHRRLSIIDLTNAGHQPMLNEVEDIVISFNGEIYNYLELKKELEAFGYRFRTKTDTEVILKAYQYWGTKAFNKLEGIFAFALYDKKNHLFFLVRDHIGVKPLYYFLSESELLFASEVKAFTAIRPWPVNPDWKILFLAFGSIPHPYTTLADVIQLHSGCYLKLDTINFKSEIVSFAPIDNYDYTVNTEQEALTSINFALQKSVQKNLISDAKLGVFFSGGIDSSLLTLLSDKFLKSVNTLSVNFEDNSYDEHPYQEMVLNKTENVEHTAHRVTEHMFWDYLEDIWKAMDQPSIDAVNAYFVSRFARAEGIKAVLSGLGADEIFGGYASFKRIKWMRLLRKIPKKAILGQILSRFRKAWGRLVYLTLEGAIGDYLFLRGIHTPKEISLILQIPETKIWEVLHKIPFSMISPTDDIEYASFLESKIYMSNQLLKDTDYMGMWHGVEVRVPFLDIELLKKVRNIPPSIRYKTDWPKYLLTAAHENVLPRKIIFRKKRGFTFPFALWMLRSSNRFTSLMPENRQSDLLMDQFKHGDCHWSKCWSLVVIEQFK